MSVEHFGYAGYSDLALNKKKSGFQVDGVHARDKVVQRELRAATVVRRRHSVRERKSCLWIVPAVPAKSGSVRDPLEILDDRYDRRSKISTNT